MAEHVTVNHGVVGSSPTRGAIKNPDLFDRDFLFIAYKCSLEIIETTSEQYSSKQYESDRYWFCTLAYFTNNAGMTIIFNAVDDTKPPIITIAIGD